MDKFYNDPRIRTYWSVHAIGTINQFDSESDAIKYATEKYSSVVTPLVYRCELIAVVESTPTLVVMNTRGHHEGQ